MCGKLCVLAVVVSLINSNLRASSLFISSMGRGRGGGGEGGELLNSCLLLFCDCDISFETLAHTTSKDTWGIPPQRIHLEN